jgi:hypothetical protein
VLGWANSDYLLEATASLGRRTPAFRIVIRPGVERSGTVGARGPGTGEANGRSPSIYFEFTVPAPRARQVTIRLDSTPLSPLEDAGPELHLLHDDGRLIPGASDPSRSAAKCLQLSLPPGDYVIWVKGCTARAAAPAACHAADFTLRLSLSP